MAQGPQKKNLPPGCMWSVKLKIFTTRTFTEKFAKQGTFQVLTHTHLSWIFLASSYPQPHWTTYTLFSHRASIIAWLHAVAHHLWSLSPGWYLVFNFRLALSSSRKPSLNTCLVRTNQAEFIVLSLALPQFLLNIPNITTHITLFFSYGSYFPAFLHAY